MSLGLQASADGNAVNIMLGATVLASISLNGLEAGTLIASGDEARALTSDKKLLTPLRLNSAFIGANQSLLENGYQKLPGGLILQWATLTSAPATANGATGTITFPIAFPNACLNVTIGSVIGVVASNSDEGLALRTKTTANFTYENQYNGLSVSATRLFSYFAIGY